VCLASALALRPSLLLLDEPTSQLDPAGTRAVFEVLRRLSRERRATIVIVEHKLGWLAASVDRLLALHEGRLVADGAPREVLARALGERWGVGATEYTRAAQVLLERRLIPPLALLPATLEQAVEVAR
jgi:energy-coupling factor transporter ATP-binding protein EcfA2